MAANASPARASSSDVEELCDATRSVCTFGAIGFGAGLVGVGVPGIGFVGWAGGMTVPFGRPLHVAGIVPVALNADLLVLPSTVIVTVFPAWLIF